LLCFLLGSALVSAQELPSAPGTLVDVGGYNLHLYCMGEGSPTVIIETGLTVQALSWKSAQTAMSEFTRVCTYDRAGYGWSDVGVMPRTARQITSELVTLLTNADIEAPYVLVGHSIGGTYMRYLAATQPDLVAGVVLVDASPPDYFALVDTVPSVAQGLLAESMGFEEFFFGMRASGEFVGFPAPGVTEEDTETYVALAARQSFWETAYSELVSAGHSLDQTRAAGDLDDLPLIVLSATLPFGDTPEEAEAQGLWIEAQEAQAALSTQGEFLAVEDSRHYIYVDQPQVVIDAVREIVEGAAAQ
jgi:pimeloyl-ACP methyl ester carboxylesterase